MRPATVVSASAALIKAKCDAMPSISSKARNSSRHPKQTLDHRCAISTHRWRLRHQCSGFDFIECTMCRHISSRLLRPGLCAYRSWQSHRFRKRLVHVASFEALKGARVTGLGVRRRLVDPMHLGECAKLPPEARPPAIIGSAMPEIGSESLIFIDEIIEPYGTA